MGLHHQIQKFQQDVPRNDVTGTFMALHVLFLQLQVHFTLLLTSTLLVVNLCVYVCQFWIDLPVVSGSLFNPVSTTWNKLLCSKSCFGSCLLELIEDSEGAMEGGFFHADRSLWIDGSWSNGLPPSGYGWTCDLFPVLLSFLIPYFWSCCIEYATLKSHGLTISLDSKFMVYWSPLSVTVDVWTAS